MISIVKGNDFKLRIPVQKLIDVDGEVTTEDFDLSSASELSVYVSRTFKKEQIPFTIDEDKHTLNLVFDGTLYDKGTYSIEIVAKAGGNNLRSKQIGQFKIVDNNEQASMPDGTEFSYTIYNLSAVQVVPYGLSAYEVAVKCGFTGTEKDWVAYVRYITREDIDKVLFGDVTTHNHATEIADALSFYVKKVSGYDLSKNDFTDELKARLLSLSNYDDTSVRNEINTLTERFNSLLEGNASTAIDTFNEITAFLANISDSQTLEGIIAGINKRIDNSLSQAKEYADSASNSAVEKSKVYTDSAVYNMKKSIPTAVSQLTNDRLFISEAAVDAKIRPLQKQIEDLQKQIKS